MKVYSRPLIALFCIVSFGFAIGIMWTGSGARQSASKPTEVKPVEPHPIAEIQDPTYDFGKHLVGTKDQHTFTIKNSGNAPLSLELGKPSCHCTIGEITTIGDSGQSQVDSRQSVIVPANESANITVKWTSMSRTQMFRQQVPVHTNDPGKSEIDLEIFGIIDYAVTLIPNEVWDAGELSRTAPTKLVGYAFSTMFEHFKLAEVPRQSSVATVMLEPADAEFLASKNAKSGYKITVEVSPDLPNGPYREMIQLKLDGFTDETTVPETAASELQTTDPADARPDDRWFVLQVLVQGRRSPLVAVRGVTGAKFDADRNKLILGEFPATDGKNAELTLVVKAMNDALQLNSVEPSEGRIKFTLDDRWKPLGENTKLFQVKVEIPPGLPADHTGLNAETVHLKLNHPEVPDFELVIDYKAKK